jgi:RNA polymerase sigma factor (sigma-70 family)
MAGGCQVGDPVAVMKDDRELLSLWRSGDDAAGKQLFARHGAAITAYFRRKLYDTSEVEQLVNQTFFACIATKTPFLGTAAAVRAYLFGIAHNKVREHLRRVRTAAKLVDSNADAEAVAEVTLEQLDPRDPSDFVEKMEDRKLILKGLRRIPLDYQLIFELSFWEGLSNPEIAEALKIPVGTVASRLRLGKERLEAAVKELAKSPTLLATTTMTLSTWIAQLQAHEPRLKRE